MHISGNALRRICKLLPSICLLVPFSSSVALAQVKIIQPGPPGESVRELSAEEASKIAANSYSPDDVRFMQYMIPHHQQATQMAALVGDRTNQPELVEIARRIDASQADEIAFMQQWLRDRGEAIPDPSAHHAMHTDHDMAGMATPEQMQELADASGIEFDRLFLTMMITHHQVAVDMVEDLLKQPGAAYDPILFDFTTDVTNDQTVEIERMVALYASLSDDPRSALRAGVFDAEIAILNMKHVGFMRKAPGFFDPGNPGELPPENPNDEEKEAEETPTYDPDERYPLLGFWYSDMAFFDDILVVGGYHGFNMYELSGEGMPKHVSSVVCPGGQGDVSVVGDLLIMSVQDQRARLDCGLQGVDADASPDRFRGVRIFDISDVSRPVQVGAVQTCRGSHTHSVVSADDDKIFVYNSGTSDIRDSEEMESCVKELPGTDETALFRIDVIEIPVDNPASSRIVDSPAVFADDAGQLAGLWRGGDHGDKTQETEITDHCHDITIFPDLKMAAGACSGNGILFDISDPLNPVRIDAVTDPGFAYWHSATFNNDGTKVLFTDEWGGGTRARCRVQDPVDWGADAIYDIIDGKLVFQSYFKLPAPQVEQENCVAHNGSIIPVPGRDIFVQAWYQGGISVVDFTDSANPVEIAYFDRGPIDAEKLVGGGFWSTYWYKGRVYGTEMVRGLDVFEMLPNEYLTENEIAAAKLADYNNTFNPQQQVKLTWPAQPVVMHALIDQLQRSDVVSELEARVVRSYVDELADSSKKRREVVLKRLQEFASEHAASSVSAKLLADLVDQIS